MTIRQLQEYIEKAMRECGLKPEDEVIVYDIFHDEYNYIREVYAEGRELTIEFQNSVKI